MFAHQHPAPGQRVAPFGFFDLQAALGNAHGVILLGVSSNQLKLKRVPAKQCYSISEFRFKFKALDTDEKFSREFARAGTDPYYRSIHPKMTAKVVVE